MLTSISKLFKNHHFNSVVQIIATTLLFSLILIFNTTANAGTKYFACNTQQFENILKKNNLVSPIAADFRSAIETPDHITGLYGFQILYI